MSDGYVAETVRGGLSEATRGELVEFWTRHRVLSAEAAERRLDEVVCLLRDGGEIVATNSVYADTVEMLGGRRLWLYRTFASPGAPPAAEGFEPLLGAAAAALEAEWIDKHGPEPPPEVRPLPLVEDPIGICAFVGDPEVLAANPAAVWPGSAMVYAGYDADGAQLRVRYFPGAAV